jgi:hypothetical protein
LNTSQVHLTLDEEPRRTISDSPRAWPMSQKCLACVKGPVRKLNTDIVEHQFAADWAGQPKGTEAHVVSSDRLPSHEDGVSDVENLTDPL